MDLLDRIRQAMEQRDKVHPGIFEECAVALLQSHYSGLVGVGGGHDFGRDGDIYFPIGSFESEKRGRLTVTIGDAVKNLRGGLERMKDNEVSIDRLVVATLQPVNGRTRQALDKLCDERGVVRPRVYDGDWFALRLIKEPLWRKRLLGVAGELSALLDEPLQELAGPKIIGRGEELEALQSSITAGEDVVVSGPAGVGKTRLVAAVQAELAFLQLARSSADVVDALVQQRPTAVVVDDAHTRTDDLVMLRAVRQQEGLSFSLIAVTWPSKRRELERALPDANDVIVKPLPRPAIDDIIKSLGVTGYTARSLVLDQAQGRPGWAVLLSRAFAEGRGDTVASGAALMNNVEGVLLQTAESERALDVLACIAVLGRADLELLEQIAELIDMPRGEARRLVERLARNGLLDEAGDGWELLPALCAPLVAQWFFADRPQLRWQRAQNTFIGQERSLGRAAIDAASVGAVPAARWAAEVYVQSLPHPAEWSPAVVDTVAAYGRLDERAAALVVKKAELLLVEPCEMVPIRGVVIDFGRGHAVNLLAGVAQCCVLPQAVMSLLDLALTGVRDRQNYARHPLTTLQDLATSLHPDFGPSIEVRQRLLSAALNWLADRPAETAWRVAAELLASVFSVTAGNAWQDPGRPGTLQVADWLLSTEQLEKLAELWPQVAEAVRDERGCPPEALLVLLESVAGWLRLGEGFSVGPEGTRITDEQRQAALRGGETMLQSLRDRVQAVPGLALRANRLLREMWQRTAARSDRPALFDTDTDLVALVGESEPLLADNRDAALQARTRALEELAERAAALDPEDGAERFAALDAQARLALHDRAGFGADPTALLAQLMRGHLSDPAGWLQAAVTYDCPSLAGAAVGRCLDDGGPPLPAAALAVLLEDTELRHHAITAALAARRLNEPAISLLNQLGLDDSWLMMTLATSPGLCDDVRLHLLTHHDPVVAGRTALAFDIGQGSQLHGERHQGLPLPPRWRPQWRHAFAGLRTAHLSDESYLFRVGEILEYLVGHDPDLAELWFVNRLGDAGEARVPDSAPIFLERSLRRLPAAHRERLARRCARRTWAGQSWLTHLIGSNPALAQKLLGDGALSADDLLRALHGQRDETVDHLGPLLLAAGITPEAVATAIVIGRPITLAVAGTQHRELRDFFGHLDARVPQLREVAELGYQEQQANLEQAEAEQLYRQEHGW